MTAAPGGDAPWCLPPERIVVVADLTIASKNALWRAALIAREYGAFLHVLHAARDPQDAASGQQALRQLCDGIHERVGVRSELEVVRDMRPHLSRAAAAAGLLVLAPRPVSSLRDRIRAAPLERVIRASRIPILVVKRPAVPPRDASRGDDGLRGCYGRMLVCVDIARQAAGVIAAASCYSTDGAMEVLHVVGAGRDASTKAGCAASAQATAVERARANVHALIVAAGAHGEGAQASVGFGQAAACVLARQRAVAAELLVIGQRPPGRFADFFLGSVTQQILDGTRSDLLIVPSSVSAALAEDRSHLAVRDAEPVA